MVPIVGADLAVSAVDSEGREGIVGRWARTARRRFALASSMWLLETGL